MISLLLFSSFIVMLLLGFPVTFAMGIATFLGLVVGSYPLQVIAQSLGRSTMNFTLMAVPFFILAGNVMNSMGLTRRMFNFARATVGHIRGGLAHVNILASMIFAGISGSAAADCAGLGLIEIQAMTEAGYSKEFSAAVTVASSTIGPIIPPSITLILYGVIAEVSIAKLFIAGLLPGITIGLILMVVVFFLSKTGKVDCPLERKRTLKERFAAFKEGILALMAPLIILYGMTGGLITPTEAGVLAVLYSLLVGFIYKEFRISDLPQILVDTVISSAHILLLVGMASVMGYLMTQERTPILVGQWILAMTGNKYIVLLLILAVLLFIGCFMSGTAAMIILTPIFLPVVQELGINPVHFGVIMAYGLVIGIATPPVGIGLFTVAEVADLSFEKTVSASLPFLVPLLVALLVIAYIPQVSLLLPSLLMK